MRTVHWMSLITGKYGHGIPMTDEDAIGSMKFWNKEYKGIIHHWTEEAPEEVV